jgi:hypothetical protein
MAIDAVYTSATFNSYVTAIEASTLIANLAAVIGSDEGYSAKTTPEKEALILASAESLNNVVFEGLLVDDVLVKTMLFPRSGLYHIGGSPVATNAVPQQVKNYCAAWIVYQLRNNKKSKGAPLKSKSVGGVSVTWAKNSGITKPAYISAMGKIPSSWHTGVQLLGVSQADIQRRF